MMRAGAGHSNEVDGIIAVQTALAEAMRGGMAPDVVFLFATYHHLPRIPDMVETAMHIAGIEAVIGCSCMGVLTDARENDREPGVAVMAIESSQLTAMPVFGQGGDAGVQIGERILPFLMQDAVLVLLPGVSVNPGALMRQIADVAGAVPIVGGMASGNPWRPESPRTLQWYGKAIAEDGVAGVLLTGVRITTGVAQGCQPFGQAYAITQAEGHAIRQIAFAPAVDALKEALDTLAVEEKAHLRNNIFVGLAMDEYATGRGRGDFLIRSLIGIDNQSGALAINEPVSVGQTVQFHRRTPDAAHEDIVQVVRRLKGKVGQTSQVCGLYFNCLGRGFGLYGQPDHDVLVIRKHFGAFPMAGFFGNAEFAPVGGQNFSHAYTGVLTLLWEE